MSLDEAQLYNLYNRGSSCSCGELKLKVECLIKHLGLEAKRLKTREEYTFKLQKSAKTKPLK